MGTADLHVHTARGDGMAEIPELLAYIEERTDLSLVAVTEHDDLSVALEARDACARGQYRFDVIAAEEVTTLDGHLLALFVESPVASFQPLAPTLEAVHRQGGLCIIPHPMSWLTRSIGQRAIERIQRDGGDGIAFDGMEFGRSPAARVTARKARRLNRERFHLSEVGGSDAHFLEAVGSARTEFEGTTADELRAAIESGATSASHGDYPSIRQLGVRRVLRQQLRGLGTTPRKMGWRRTIASFIPGVRP